MHASFAVFPLMTVTLVGVVGSIKGARVVEVLGVPLLDVGSPILLAAKLGHWRKLLAVTPMNQTKHKYPWGDLLLLSVRSRMTERGQSQPNVTSATMQPQPTLRCGKVLSKRPYDFAIICKWVSCRYRCVDIW